MFDSLAISAIRDELLDFRGGRVQRVVQVDPLTVGMELYALGERRWLLATADPRRSGLWFVDHKLGQSPDPPGPLLLLMRKHLRGARLEDAAQPAFERVLRLRFATWSHDDSPPANDPELPPEDDGAATRSLELIVEATGRLGNVILVDEKGIVMDALKRVPPSINRQRTILPRRPYVGPPPQSKASPWELDARMLEEATGPAAKALVGVVRGISPLAAHEVVFRATGRTDTPAASVDSTRLIAALRELLAPLAGETVWQPSIGLEEGRVVAFAPYPLTHLTHEPVETLSRAAERSFAQEQPSRSPVAQAQATLRGEIETQRAREARRLEALERELGSEAEVGRLRESGELIFAYASQIAPKAERLELPDRTIELDPSLTPVENAQSYFDRYARLRDARRRLPAMIDEARARIAYLDEMLVHLALARTTEDVVSLRLELHDEPKKVAKGGRGAPARASGPLRVTVDGHVVYVGRSARQNEAATFELARPQDLWLHARGVAGGHVILRVEGSKPGPATIERAAEIAAFHSEARTSGRVPVDVTERRHVRKIKGSPGAVTYSGERSISVVPRAADAS